MWRCLTIGILLGIGFSLASLAIARNYAPSDFSAEENDKILLNALAKTLRGFEKPKNNIIYVRGWLSSELKRKLEAKYPGAIFDYYAKRPEDKGCISLDPAVLVMAPCERPDYIYADIVSYPIWRVAIVRTGTYNSGAESIAVKFGSAWQIVSTRGYVV